MTAITPVIHHRVKEFLASVAKERRITAAYIYGSEARGQAGPWSDIDVAVVSPDFDDDDLFGAQLALMLLAAKVDDRIEPRAFTPQSFNANSPLASEIRKTGIRII